MIGRMKSGSQEEHLLAESLRSTAVPTMNEDCITQILRKFKAAYLKNISPYRSQTEHKILGAFLKSYEFFPCCKFSFNWEAFRELLET